VIRHRLLRLALAAALVGPAACRGTSGAQDEAAVATIPVTITGTGGRHVFQAELARTAAQQEKGLMYRTGLGPDFAMLFAPYPPDGGPPVATSFWMRNTPSSLDIVFIRPDGTIARIAENTVPLDETPLASGEPVAAVLEVRGGRMAELGLGEGDRVQWTLPGVPHAGG